MDINKVCEKVTDEIIEHFRLPRKICYGFIKERLTWVYAAGHEEGRATSSNRKPVAQFDLQGRYMRTFESVSQAARILDFPGSSISKCAKGRKNYNTACGYKWKYL